MMPISIRRVAAAALIFFAIGCDGGEGDPPTDPVQDAKVETDADLPDPEPDAAPDPDPICEADRRRCTDDGVEVCVEGTAWQVLGPCPGGTVCEDGECVEPACVPDCQGRICGSDGCDGVCGECEPGETCNLEGRCDPPPPTCGDDACNGDEDCSTCPADCGSCCGDGTCAADAGESCTTCPADCACAPGEVCNAVSSICEVCQPQCAGRECGADGCGGECGACADGVACDAGRCDTPCVPQCDGRSCGADGCGAQCGVCEGGQVCNADGACADPPARCGDGQCGGDEDCSTCPADCGNCCGDGECVAGVGEDCSTCPADCGCPDGEACDAPNRRCEPVCVPQCDGRNCGDDGCNGVCGNCVGGQECDAGVCRDLCQPQCDGRECGGDGCDGSCGACPDGESCTDGTCEAICTPNCEDRVCGPDGCEGFCGNCGVGAFCTEDGLCEDVCVPDCAGRECGDNGCGGDCGGCGGDEECDEVAGQCVERCAPICDGRECGDDGCGGECGACPDDGICAPGGICVGAGGCDCDDPDDICLDGACRAPADLCSEENPVGLCPGGRACLAGGCVDQGAGCSDNNPTGACPAGEACRNGDCVALDGSVLCDDDNACTDDLYDPVRNRCVNVPVDAQCSDGNACTADMCMNGECVAEAIADCVEPPSVEPVRSPTNQGDLVLTGTKPAGASVLINGAEAAPESPEQVWSIELQLQPGENVFEIGTRDMGAESETVTITVVYDITPPVITVTPDGGIYLDGITVTVSTDEPATVYYTDDGGEPETWTKQFRSIKRLRVFNDTTFRFRARDVAGNWSEGVVESAFEITAEGTAWHELAPLPETLINAATAARADGMWLVGGSDGLEPQAGTWRYENPEEGWVAGPALPTARSQAALVSTGDLIVIGGQDDGVPLNTVQVLRVDGEAWIDRAPMPTTRFGLGAERVGDFIYAFGGKTNGGVVLSTAERYNIRTNVWDNDIPQMPRPRYGFATVVFDSRIYLIGGEDEEGVPIAEIDVFVAGGLNEWQAIPALPTARSFPSAGVIGNPGRVTGGHVDIVVAGGRLADGSATAVVESFVLGEGHWRQRRPLDAPRQAASGGVLRVLGLDEDSQDDVLVLAGGLIGGGGPVGAGGTETVVAFSHTKDYLRGLHDLPEGRFAHAAIELNGLFYIFGGRSFQATDAFWAYDPETGRTVDLPALPSVQNGLAGVELEGQLYAIGGANQFNNAVPTLRRYEPGSRRWSELRPMISARRDAAAAVIDGEIWVVGGDNNGPQQAVEIYDPETDRWRAGPVLPEARSGARIVLFEGDIVLVGGRRPNGNLVTTTQRLVNGAWQNSVALRSGYVDHQATLVRGTHLMVFGGRGADGPTAEIGGVDVVSGQVDGIRAPSTNLLAARDLAATVPHHGRIYLVGGNVNAEVGPDGVPTVQALQASCFDGQLGELESNRDSGGGCMSFTVQDFDLRLAGGQRLGVRDRLEMYRDGAWYGICDDSWDHIDAGVACRQMFGPQARGVGAQSGRGPNASFILDDVNCRGAEQRLIDCGNNGLFRHNCGVGEWAQVTCTLP